MMASNLLHLMLYVASCLGLGEDWTSLLQVGDDENSEVFPRGETRPTGYKGGDGVAGTDPTDGMIRAEAAKFLAYDHPELFPYYLYPYVYPVWEGPEFERAYVCCWKEGSAPRPMVGRCAPPNYVEVYVQRCGAKNPPVTPAPTPPTPQPTYADTTDNPTPQPTPLLTPAPTPPTDAPTRAPTPPPTPHPTWGTFAPTPAPEIREELVSGATQTTSNGGRVEKVPDSADSYCISTETYINTQDCLESWSCNPTNAKGPTGCVVDNDGNRDQWMMAQDFGLITEQLNNVNKVLARGNLLYMPTGRYTLYYTEPNQFHAGTLFFPKNNNAEKNLLWRAKCGVVYDSTAVYQLGASPKEMTYGLFGQSPTMNPDSRVREFVKANAYWKSIFKARDIGEDNLVAVLLNFGASDDRKFVKDTLFSLASTGEKTCKFPVEMTLASLFYYRVCERSGTEGCIPNNCMTDAPSQQMGDRMAAGKRLRLTEPNEVVFMPGAAEVLGCVSMDGQFGCEMDTRMCRGKPLLRYNQKTLRFESCARSKLELWASQGSDKIKYRNEMTGSFYKCEARSASLWQPSSWTQPRAGNDIFKYKRRLKTGGLNAEGNGDE